MRPIIGGPIAVLRWNRQANIVTQVKFHWLAHKIQTCLKGLLRLLLLASQTIVPAIFDEMRTDFYKRKGYISRLALLMQSQHPIIITGTCPLIIFAATDNLFDKAFLQIRFQAYGADQRRTHHAFMPEGQRLKQRQPDISHCLIFTGDIEPNILPTAAKILRQAVSHPFRTLGQQIK